MSIKLEFPKNKNTYVIFKDDMTVAQRNAYYDAVLMDTEPEDGTVSEKQKREKELKKKQNDLLVKAMSAVIEEVHVEVGDQIITDVKAMLNIDEEKLTVALDSFLATLFMEYNREVTQSGNAMRVK